MLILVDLDGTIAQRNPRVLAPLYNHVLKLDIPRQDLETLTPEAFLQRPEVMSCRRQMGEARFHHLLNYARLTPIYWRSCLPTPGALQAIYSLSTLGELRYATCRKLAPFDPAKKAIEDKLNSDIEQATHQWLAEQGFPQPDSVLFCSSLREKLSAIAGLIEQTKEPALLVDDLSPRLLAEAPFLPAHQKAYLQAFFTLAAYGASRDCLFSEVNCFARVVPLPDWTDLDALFASLLFPSRIA